MCVKGFFVCVVGAIISPHTAAVTHFCLASAVTIALCGVTIPDKLARGGYAAGAVRRLLAIPALPGDLVEYICSAVANWIKKKLTQHRNSVARNADAILAV
jgi:hypothetical protein